MGVPAKPHPSLATEGASERIVTVQKHNLRLTFAFRFCLWFSHFGPFLKTRALEFWFSGL